jgi:hypoxanthine-DNA glycosylase
MKSAFPPIVNAKSKILILGSMPGEASLAAGQYYAFKRNAFWKIMASIFNFSFDASYEERVNALLANGIALWDVIEQCKREGSLDSSIEQTTLVANNFSAFLKQYADIEKIVFNGKTVQALFKRHVLSKQTLPAKIELEVLPSTSPANARLGFESKLEAWRLALRK